MARAADADPEVHRILRTSPKGTPRKTPPKTPKRSPRQTPKTVAELRQVLEQLGLPTSGKKDELTQRIAANQLRGEPKVRRALFPDNVTADDIVDDGKPESIVASPSKRLKTPEKTPRKTPLKTPQTPKTMAELRAALKDLGLSTTGKKAELVQRLSGNQLPEQTLGSTSAKPKTRRALFPNI